MHELKWWRSFVILVIRMWKPNIELNFKAPSCENFHRYFEIWKVRLLSHSWMGGRERTANRSIWQNILTLAFFCLFYLQPKMQHGGNGACMLSFSQFVKKRKMFLRDQWYLVRFPKPLPGVRRQAGNLSNWYHSMGVPCTIPWGSLITFGTHTSDVTDMHLRLVNPIGSISVKTLNWYQEDMKLCWNCDFLSSCLSGRFFAWMRRLFCGDYRIIALMRHRAAARKPALLFYHWQKLNSCEGKQIQSHLKILAK